MCACMYVCLSVCMYMYMYMYMYIYTYMYIHINMCTYTSTNAYKLIYIYIVQICCLYIYIYTYHMRICDHTCRYCMQYRTHVLYSYSVGNWQVDWEKVQAISTVFCRLKKNSIRNDSSKLKNMQTSFGKILKNCKKTWPCCRTCSSQWNFSSGWYFSPRGIGQPFMLIILNHSNPCS
jgi:hypothetical protein